jgi:hypothetical protein
MEKNNTNNEYICEEFCYHRESNAFPSQFFSGENLSYILTEIKKEPKQRKAKK